MLKLNQQDLVGEQLRHNKKQHEIIVLSISISGKKNSTALIRDEVLKGAGFR